MGVSALEVSPKPPFSNLPWLPFAPARQGASHRGHCSLFQLPRPGSHQLELSPLNPSIPTEICDAGSY